MSADRFEDLPITLSDRVSTPQGTCCCCCCCCSGECGSEWGGVGGDTLVHLDSILVLLLVVVLVLITRGELGDRDSIGDVEAETAGNEVGEGDTVCVCVGLTVSEATVTVRGFNLELEIIFKFTGVEVSEVTFPKVLKI